MSKKLEQKQARRQEEERRKAERRREALRRNLVTILVAVVVTALVATAIVLQKREEEGASGNIGVSIADANCTDVERPENQGRDHITQGTPHEPYSSDPPTSGPHYEIPASLGFYPEPLPPEQLVHNMEHGQIVIWYADDLPQESIELVEALYEEDRSSTVAVPYANVDAPNEIVVTAWGAMMSCEKISQAAIDEFRRRFQGKAPEGHFTGPFEG